MHGVAQVLLGRPFQQQMGPVPAALHTIHWHRSCVVPCHHKGVLSLRVVYVQ